jgi:hypothetical protein
MTAATLPAFLEVASYKLRDIPPDRIFYLPNNLTIFRSDDGKHFLSASADVLTRRSKNAMTPVWRVGNEYVLDLKTALKIDCDWNPWYPDLDTLIVRDCTIQDIPVDVPFLLDEGQLHVAADGTVWVPSDTKVSLTSRGWLGYATVRKSLHQCLSLEIDADAKRRWFFEGDVPSNGVTFTSIDTRFDFGCWKLLGQLFQRADTEPLPDPR